MTPPPQEPQLERAQCVVEAARGLKAEHSVALNVRALVSYADTLVVTTGRSDRHARSITDAVMATLSRQGEKPLGIEGYDEGRWILTDFGDLVLHVFLSEVRDHYDLERLWSDAPRMEIGEDHENALP